MIRDEMTGPLNGGLIDPPGLEAKAIELRAKQITDRSNASEIQRAAVDIDDLLEQRKPVGILRIDARGNRLLVRRQPRALPGARDDGREHERHDDQPMDAQSSSHVPSAQKTRPGLFLRFS